jgi:hypothetical protein
VSAEVRIFFAHPKGWDEDFVAARTEELIASLRVLRAQSGQHTPMRVVTGRQDWQETMGDRRGGKAWSTWATYTATGTRADGQPRYHVFVVPNGPVGQGTANMLHMALYARKAVSCWDAVDLTLRPVVGVVQENASYTEGWRLVCEGAVTGPLDPETQESTGHFRGGASASVEPTH